MLHKATIVGSQPIVTCPQFEFEHSYGLNYAHFEHKTNYAFCGHEAVYKEYKLRNVKRIIGIKPNFEGRVFNGLYDVIKFDEHNSMAMDYSADYVAKNVKSAIQNEDIAYPNRYTILHLAIFYCLKKGYKHIDLIGCGCNYEELQSSNSREQSLGRDMRRFTSEIIEEAGKLGVKITHLESENKGKTALKYELPLIKLDLTILTPQGFFKKHFELCQSHKTQQDAYDTLEDMYFTIMHKSRFTSYESLELQRLGFIRIKTTDSILLQMLT